MYEHTQMEKEATDEVSQQQREPTIIFLFDIKNWYTTVSPLSKLDLFDIAPQVSTQFYMDFGIQAYVLMLTKSKWDGLADDLKKKFMLVSRRVKEEMEGPMTTAAREKYEQADIFKLLMGEQKPPEEIPQVQEYDISLNENIPLP